MKIGIEASPVINQGGLGSYTRSLVRGLASIDPQGDYTLFFNPTLPTAPLTGAERMRRVVVPTRNALARYFVTLPLAVARERIDVFHVQYAAPPLCPARTVVTIHDLIHERHPEFYPHDMVVKYRAIVPLTVRNAAVVLTISEYSKRDIVRRYCVPPEKVVVAPRTASPAFVHIHDQSRIAIVCERYGTGEHFILSVGNIERRKNLKALIAAYVRLRQANATSAKLVLVGSRGWLHDDVFAVARQSGYADQLVFTEVVPEDDLVALYNAADLFVYPSLFEGFGLPPLEAMTCGTPVVCSNTSSLPEVVGDAALTIDPLDTDGLAETMARVLRDAGLRARLSAKGLERASLFSREREAQITLDAYRRAVEPNLRAHASTS